MSKVSIIVPIYNAEKYLKECLDSIINQTYPNLEILLINDGSSDNSKEICEKYKKDVRVSLITIENRGVSNARNIGLKNATGDYIMFIDADDYYECDMVEKMIEKAKDHTFVICGYFLTFKNKEKKVICKNIKEQKENVLKSIASNNELAGFLWNKLFKTSIIKQYHLEFHKDIHLCEDLLFVIDYLNKVDQIAYIPLPLYHYRMRKNSATNKKINKKNITSLYAYENIIRKIDDNEIRRLFCFRYLKGYYQYKKIMDQEVKINFDILDEEKYIIKSMNKKERIKFFIIKHFPMLYVKLKELKEDKNQFFE